MSVANYTPGTVARIRETSANWSAAEIARDLGWDLPRVLRVAQRHSIAVVNPMSVEQAVKAAAPPPVPRKDSYRKSGMFYIDQDMTINEIIMVLPERQSRVLAILAHHLDGKCINSGQLVERLGGKRICVQHTISILRVRLRSSRFGIEGRRNRGGGGYRLITVRSASP